MESEDWNASPDIRPIDRLRARPHGFDFYFALRVLENEAKQSPRIGTAKHANQDPARFGQTASLQFAPTTITQFGETRDSVLPKLQVLFFGLFGPNGPLPLHMTQHAYENGKVKNADPVFARFADMFHHRMISLFYRAWAAAQPTVQFDRPASDRFSTYIGSLFGMGTDLSRNRDSVPDQAKFFFAGLFANQVRNAEGLRSILADFFDVPVKIAQFQKRMLRIPSRDYFRLGVSERNNSLGVTTIAGTTVASGDSLICIDMGPLNRESFESFLPGRTGLVKLTDFVRCYTNGQWAWELRLTLRKEEAQCMRLGQYGRLGWSSWLGTSHPSSTDLCVTIDGNSGKVIRELSDQRVQSS